MATTEVLTPTSVPFSMAHLTSPLPAKSSKERSILSLENDHQPKPDRVQFDPKKHLEFTPPSKTHSMKELGYSDDAGVSRTGVSEPFPLFSAEAIKQMRKEVLSDAVWSKYKYSSNLAQCMLRGFAPECAPFVYDAWRNPETLAIISKIAGVDLVPALDWEIGHVNISVKSEQDKEREIENATAETSGENDVDDKPIVDWHTDSYPFVCVTMLSDCTDMIGGETALRKGDGSIVKVRGPQMGCAVVLQGRYIEHQALRALGTTERISMVTSFRPRSAALPDDTVLTTVRPISDLSELYFQFSEYRLEMLEERIRTQLKDMRERKRARRRFDTKNMKRFIAEQEKFLAHMNREMVEDDRVIKGFTDDSHLLTEELRQRDRKKSQEWVSANWDQKN